LVWRGKGPGGSIAQTTDTFLLEARDPFADGLRAGVELARCGCLGQAVIQNGPNHELSTFGGQNGILMSVHSVLRESLGLATSAFTVGTEWTTS
jgi:hypothetical protein